MEFEGHFEGTLHLDPIKYSRILSKVVLKNNKTSGKILVPAEYISERVVVLLLKKDNKS